MISLMYHSDILEDAFEYVLGMDKDDPDAPKYEEKLKIVWSYTFKIVKWAQGNIFSYPNLKSLLVESIEIARDALKDKKRRNQKRVGAKARSQKERAGRKAEETGRREEKGTGKEGRV